MCVHSYKHIYGIVDVCVRTYMCVCVFFSFSTYYIVDRLLLANVPAATQLRQLLQTISRARAGDTVRMNVTAK